MGRNRCRKGGQCLRQEKNCARKRKNNNDLKLRIGCRTRSIPMIERFNHRVRKRKGDETYENHDLETLARHN